ncbi:PHD finger protein 21B isoform X2 [Antennarius striatus]|uniref:PHD finger protein 21B isoform X2 n=1 Tax=Antennarius striatus TaxID=241820 RepID=UPI0035AEB250
MELQGLPEALTVELQCHQNQTLCKGLNELQNGPLAVRSCPVGTTKPLSLIKPPTQSIAISVVPAKSPVSMVTAHINGQKAASSEPLQTSPINLQTGGRAAAPGYPFSSRRAGEPPPSQVLGSLAAAPIKVPQVSSLHRLAGQAATLLPQVRPKTLIPESLPCRPCVELQPLSLQRPAPPAAVVSPWGQGPTLPTANSTCSPAPQPNGQNDASPPSGAPESGGPAQHASAGPGVAYAIIAAAANGVSAVNEAVKVIIIQPQVPVSTEATPTVQAHLPSQDAPLATAHKTDEDPEKIAFMVALGLVTTEHLEEIQTKRQERKRRSTANPAYSGLFEPERKRLASHYLNSSLFLSAPDSEDFSWKEDLEHDDHCAVCEEDGELQPCHNCPRAFHPHCLHPPLKTPPRGSWYCPKCQKKVLNKENMSWPQNFVQSYVTHKTVRQEEKRRLLRRNGELKNECSHLEEQDKQLDDTLNRCMQLRARLLGQQRDTQAALERLRALIRLIQRHQLLQVTLTPALLPLSWTKPTSTAPGPSATTPQGHGQDDANN